MRVALVSAAYSVVMTMATTVLSLSLHTAHASEACLRTLTTVCDSGKTACIEDCYGRVLDGLEYIEAQDAASEAVEPPMALGEGGGEDALGLSVAVTGAERLVVDSLPRFTRWLYISDIHLSSEKPLVVPNSKAKLRNVYLSGREISSLARVALPDSVTMLSVFDSSLTTLSDARLPPKLQTLYVANNKIATIGSLPPTVKHLDLHGNSLSTLSDVSLPVELQSLDLSVNKLTRLADVVFPAALRELRLDSNALREISNVTFPGVSGGAGAGAGDSVTVSLRKNAIRSIRLTAAQWKAFKTIVDASVLETVPTHTAECTSGHFAEDGKDPVAFTACLLIG